MTTPSNPTPSGEPALLPVKPHATKWTTFATWPADTGVEWSSDLHDTQEAARTICYRLETYGFGGDREYFPIRTLVIPPAPEKSKPSSVAGTRPEICHECGRVGKHCFDCTSEPLYKLGLSAEEISAVECLKASQVLSLLQVMRQAIRHYQMATSPQPPDDGPTPETDGKAFYCERVYLNLPADGTLSREELNDRGRAISITDARSLARRLRAVQTERDEWRCSAKLYHSELRALAAGKKVETNLAFPVEQIIRALTAERDALKAERLTLLATVSAQKDIAALRNAAIETAEKEITSLRSERNEARAGVSRLVARVYDPEANSDNCPFCEHYPATGHAQQVPQCPLCSREESISQMRAEVSRLTELQKNTLANVHFWESASEKNRESLSTARARIEELESALRVISDSLSIVEHKFERAGGIWEVAGRGVPLGANSWASNVENGINNARAAIDAAATPVAPEKSGEQ